MIGFEGVCACCVCVHAGFVSTSAGFMCACVQEEESGGNGGKGMFATLAIWSKTAI